MPNCPRCLKKYLGRKCSHCQGGAFNIAKGESSFVESGFVTMAEGGELFKGDRRVILQSTLLKALLNRKKTCSMILNENASTFRRNLTYHINTLKPQTTSEKHFILID